jgi:ADP-heptose:LPS heptosyltransferase
MRFLLIRLRLIGDVVFTTPIPRALKQAFPSARVDYLVEEPARPVLAGHPCIDDLIVAERPRGLARVAADIRLALAIRRARYDVVLDLHGGPRASWLTFASGAQQRIGYDIPGRRWMYTRTVHRARELRPRHSVANQWDLLGAIDGWPGGPPDPARNSVEMTADPAIEARIEQRLAAAGIGGEHELVVAHVSAGNPFRRWPESAFAQLVTGLAIASPRRRIVLSSGPSDRLAAVRIADESRRQLRAAAERVVDFGELDLAELRSIVARSRVFIGGDTGPLHGAATTGAPIVGIYGPTLPERSAPWRDPSVPTEAIEVQGLVCRPCDQRTCAPGDFRCLTMLRAEDVLAAAERVMRPRT